MFFCLHFILYFQVFIFHPCVIKFLSLNPQCSVSSAAVGSAITGVVTAVTVIRLPVTIYTSVVSGVLGITSIILTSFQKIYRKESIKEKELYIHYAM